MLPAVRISPHAHADPGAAPDAALILLHGLGSSPEDFRNAARLLELPRTARIEFVLPQAPTLPVTMNAGAEMPAWYDIPSLQEGSPQDAAGIRRASGEIGELVAELHARGVHHQRIVVGGFSQGGAAALHYASRAATPLAGAIALSAYLPLLDELPRAATATGRATPIFMSHGAHDEIIPLDYALTSRTALEQAGFAVTWREYPLGHSLDAQVLADLSRWLTQRLEQVQPR